MTIAVPGAPGSFIPTIDRWNRVFDMEGNPDFSGWVPEKEPFFEEFDMRPEHYVTFEDLFSLYARWYAAGGINVHINNRCLRLYPRRTKNGAWVLNAEFIQVGDVIEPKRRETIIRAGDEKRPNDDTTTMTFHNLRRFVVKMEDLKNGTFEDKVAYDQVSKRLNTPDKITAALDAVVRLRKAFPGIEWVDIEAYVKGVESSWDKDYTR